MNIKELTRKEKEEIANRFNVSVGTIYNWIETKSELIKIIELGYEYEKIKNENKTTEASHEKTIEIIFQKLEELENKINKD
jgi:transposase